MVTVIPVITLCVANVLVAQATNTQALILNSRVKVAHLREASKLFTRIFKSWSAEHYAPELTPWALYAVGGARDTAQICKTIQKVGTSFLKDKEVALSHDALHSFRDIANLTSCEIPGLNWSKELMEEILKSMTKSHALGSFLRFFPPEDLDIAQWMAFVNEWERNVEESGNISMQRYDDLFGLFNAESYLLAATGGDPQKVIHKIAEIIRHPLFNLSLLDDTEIVYRLRAVEALTRAYTDMIGDFGMERLSSLEEFQFVKHSMYSLASSLVYTLSHDKPGSLGSAKLSYLLTALWRLERNGLIYLSSRESGDSWDITLSRPLQRWDLDLHLKLRPTDESYWKLTSDESASYTLSPLNGTTENQDIKPSLPLIDVMSSEDKVIATYQLGSKQSSLARPKTPVSVWAVTKRGRLSSLARGSHTLNLDEQIGLVIIGSGHGEEGPWTLQMCESTETPSCKEIPVYQGHLGLDTAHITLDTLPFSRFTLESKTPQRTGDISSQLHVSITLEGGLFITAEKKSKTQIQRRENHWSIDTELDYTFAKEFPRPNYVATVIFTAAVWGCPLLMLRRLHTSLSHTSKARRTPATLLKTFRESQLGSQVLYILTVTYFCGLVISLIHYWACWKLIPYSKVLILLVTFGSILTLLTLAKLESQCHQRNPSPQTVDKRGDSKAD